MPPRPLTSLLILALLCPGSWACGQSGGDPSSPGVKLGDSLTQRWQVGMVITAPNGLCTGVFGTATVPTDWPEQSVRLVKEDVSDNVHSVKFRTLDNGVRQMLVTIPVLQPNETARALLTYEVTRHSLLAPEDTAVYEKGRNFPREIRRFLTASPYIESGHTRIRALARQLAQQEQPSAWSEVESIYDWVRDHVEYTEGELKGAVAALRDGNGDCEELTSLFIALCRANRIPARTVWVPGHCYPEFYLMDEKGEGHWFPCQAAGTRDFGSMPDFRPILQKGDNFRVPEKRKPQRYVAEFLKVKAVRGGGQPQVSFVRKLLPAEG